MVIKGNGDGNVLKGGGERGKENNFEGAKRKKKK